MSVNQYPEIGRYKYINFMRRYIQQYTACTDTSAPMSNSRQTAEIKMVQTQTIGFFAFVVLYKIKHFFHCLLLQQFAFHKSFHEFYGVCRSTNNAIISF